jgi:hypothetical protein
MSTSARIMANNQARNLTIPIKTPPHKIYLDAIRSVNRQSIQSNANPKRILPWGR